MRSDVRLAFDVSVGICSVAFETTTVATVLVAWLSEVGSVVLWVLIVVEVHVSAFSERSLNMASTVLDMKGSDHVSVLLRIMKLLVVMRLYIVLKTTVTAVLPLNIPSSRVSFTAKLRVMATLALIAAVTVDRAVLMVMFGSW